MSVPWTKCFERIGDTRYFGIALFEAAVERFGYNIFDSLVWDHYNIGNPNEDSHYGNIIRVFDEHITNFLESGRVYIRNDIDVFQKLYFDEYAVIDGGMLALPNDCYVTLDYIESQIGEQLNRNYRGMKKFPLEEWIKRAKLLDLITRRIMFAVGTYNLQCTTYFIYQYSVPIGNTNFFLSAYDGSYFIHFSNYTKSLIYVLPTKTKIIFKSNKLLRSAHIDLYMTSGSYAHNRNDYYNFGYNLEYEKIYYVGGGNISEKSPELLLSTLFDDQRPKIPIITSKSYDMYPSFFSVIDLKPNLTYFGGL